ncbi:MAG: DinB family protein [Armatimonadetes bacterium]|nr:DinB family protein [Armatimonadota bacterium]
MKPYLFPGLTLSPHILRRAVQAMPSNLKDVPTHPGRFTPREVVAHMADWEPILLGRMKQCVEAPGSAIKAYDEEQMALDNGYASCDLMAKLAEFEEARKKTVEWLMTLSDEQWKATAVHEERGPMSVMDTANSMVGHDVYHIEQLTAYQESTD